MVNVKTCAEYSTPCGFKIPAETTRSQHVRY